MIETEAIGTDDRDFMHEKPSSESGQNTLESDDLLLIDKTIRRVNKCLGIHLSPSHSMPYTTFFLICRPTYHFNHVIDSFTTTLK